MYILTHLISKGYKLFRELVINYLRKEKEYLLKRQYFYVKLIQGSQTI